MNEHFKRAGPAVEAHYQFLLRLVPTVDRFPKSQKFVFGDRVLNLALDVLEGANEVVESRHFCCDARVSLWHKADMPSRRSMSAFGGKADNICAFWTTGCIPSARSLTPISPSSTPLRNLVPDGIGCANSTLANRFGTSRQISSFSTLGHAVKSFPCTAGSTRLRTASFGTST